MKLLRNFIISIYFYPLVVLITFFVSVGIIFFQILNLNYFSQKLIWFWGWSIFKMTFSSIEISGLENIDKNKIYLFCPNHASSMDIYLLNAYMPVNFLWVSKNTYFKVPVLGTVMKKMNFISVERENLRKSLISMQDVIEKIRRLNSSIAIFPEGTRSLTGLLQKFKRGSLLVAVQGQVPIVPVTIIGSYNILPKNQFLVRPSKVKLIFSKPLPVPGKTKLEQVKILTELKDIIEKNYTANFVKER